VSLKDVFFQNRDIFAKTMEKAAPFDTDNEILFGPPT
jgi:hypothetical protein